MSRTISRVHLVSLLALVGCDLRADERYPGDSLLHLEGQVVFDDEDDAVSGLVPVLAFDTARGMELLDLTVEGSFPNRFRAEIFAPPPAAARRNARDDRGLPPGAAIAIGYIAAAPPDHLRELLYAHVQYAGLPTSVLEACASAEPACQRVERWCTDRAEKDCRTVGLSCSEGERCSPSVSEGNPAIMDDPSDALAGLSENIVIIWTLDGLPASSVFSHALGIEQDLAPGYNLVELGVEPDDSSDEGFDCDGPDCPEPEPEPEDPYEAEAIARYNAAHGTDYASLDAAYEVLNAPGADPDVLIAFEDEFYAALDRILVDAGVDISELDGTRVIEDWNTPLRIFISPDADPLI